MRASEVVVNDEIEWCGRRVRVIGRAVHEPTQGRRQWVRLTVASADVSRRTLSWSANEQVEVFTAGLGPLARRVLDWDEDGQE